MIRLLVCVCVLTWPALASADVVGPEPTTCPAGGRPSACHGGPFCAPRDCTADSDCASGETCRETSVCIGSIGCAGLLPPDANPDDYRVPTVEASCASGAACGTGTCETRSLCVPIDSGGGSDDGGCAVTSPGTSSPAWLAVPVLLACGLRRRTQRR